MSLEEFISRIEAATHAKPQRTGDGFTCRCPAHDDGKPSLSVKQGDGGRILLHCHAGCSFASIASALGLSAADLGPQRDGNTAKRGRPPLSSKIVATYPYHDREGKLLFEVCRMEPKTFRQRRPDTAEPGGWTWNLNGVRQVPYRLPELIEAVKTGKTVFIAEGEKDVEALAKHGFAATCNAGGAGKWRKEFGEYFDGGKLVVVIADKDEPGRKHAAAVAVALKPVARSVKVVELPDVAACPVKDAADFFAAGGKAEALQRLAEEAPDYVPKEELTPGTWFKQRFPKLAEKHGEPVHEAITGGRAKVRDVSEDFMAATLGEEGTPEAPTIYLPSEDRFYTYSPATGIFGHQREEDIGAKLSALFLECWRVCKDSADTAKLAFDLRRAAASAGIIRRAKSLLAVPETFFDSNESDFLPVQNGVVRLSNRELLPFSPKYRYRHKLNVAFDPHAYCPMFHEKLLKSALGGDDIGVLRRWFGLALTGINHSQKILLLTGTPGGGKSTLVAVLIGVIGQVNVGTLRTESLGERFELGRFLGKQLLYGPDVSEDFLSQRSASFLKSLSGGDMVTVELKNSNESPQIRCRFNIVVTSNSRLTVNLQGDADAWRRRLVIVEFKNPKPEVPIPHLADKIIAEEGPGVLNWMLDGLQLLREAGWNLTLSERQQARVDDLLLESDSHREFAKACLIKDHAAPGITKAELFAPYVEFCDRRGWVALTKNKFGGFMPQVIAQTFGIGLRHDIKIADGKQTDGWKNLRLKNAEEAEL